ncbi:MAG: LysR family transcriptional regulator [Syntrophomonas sp.]|nr:LysR family transcriptional regulator [Syntrophomonas sp.]
MFLDQFEIIPIIAQTKSFSKAARLLHLSQPAISSKVQAMEDYYGIKFFTRTTQGVTLTEAGTIVCNYASKFMEIHQSMEKELDQLLNIANPQLIIGSSCTSGNYAMPRSIQAFKEKYPNANIKLDISNSANTLQKLRNREIDVAVVDGKVVIPNYFVHYLDSVQLVFIAANQGDKKKRNKITLKELRTKPLIVREKGAAMRSVIEELATEKGYTLRDFNVVSEMNSLHSIKAAVEGGAGITIIPIIAVQKELAAGILRIIQIEELDLKVDVNLVYSATEECSFIAQKFIKFLNQPQNSGFGWNE